MAHSFIWNGPISGVWSVNSNWNDLTLGIPAPVAPGALDFVSFASPAGLFQVISGTGAAASLALTGKNDVVGSLAVGTLTVGTSLTAGTLRVNTGASMTAADVTIGQTSSITVVGGTLAISGSVADGPVMSAITGTLTVGGTLGAGVSASTNSRVRAATVNIINGGGFIWDATSSVEVGTLGGAALGALTVDAGATLDFNITSTQASRGATLGLGLSVIDNGTIRISGPYTAFLTTGTATGTGTVIITDGGNLSATGAMAGTLAFQIGKSALLTVGTVGAGDSIAFNGAGAVLNLGSLATYNMQAAITGFGATNAITIDRLITAATYSAGVLTLANAGTTVVALKLGAGYAAGSFKVIQTGSTNAEVILAGTAAAGPSAGAGGHAYQFSGAAAGDWNTAANWTDSTLAATPAAIKMPVSRTGSLQTRLGL